MPDALSLDQARRIALALEAGRPGPARPPRTGHPACHPGAAGRHPDRLDQRGRPQPRAGPGRPGRPPPIGRLRPARLPAPGRLRGTGAMPPRSCPWTSTGCACPGCAGWPPPPAAGGSTSARATSTCYGPVLDRIRAEGPLAASAFRDPDGPRRGGWWDWAPAKHMLGPVRPRGRCWCTTGSTSSAATTWPSGSCRPGPTPPSRPRGRGRPRADPAGRRRPRRRHRRRPGRLPPAAARRGRGLPGRERSRPGSSSPFAVASWTRPAYLLPGTRGAAPGDPPAGAAEPVRLAKSGRGSATLSGCSALPAGGVRAGGQAGPRLLHHARAATGRLVAQVDPKHDRQTGRLLLRNLLEPAVDPAEAVAATAAAANRLAAHLGAGGVETGDAMPSPLAERAAGWPFGQTVPGQPAR